MKLTAKQHRNIANGIERIKSACYCAYTWNVYLKSKGTYFSDRFNKSRYLFDKNVLQDLNTVKTFYNDEPKIN